MENNNTDNLIDSIKNRLTNIETSINKMSRRRVLFVVLPLLLFALPFILLACLLYPMYKVTKKIFSFVSEVIKKIFSNFIIILLTIATMTGVWNIIGMPNYTWLDPKTAIGFTGISTFLLLFTYFYKNIKD